MQECARQNSGDIERYYAWITSDPKEVHFTYVISCSCVTARRQWSFCMRSLSGLSLQSRKVTNITLGGASNFVAHSALGICQNVADYHVNLLTSMIRVCCASALWNLHRMSLYKLVFEVTKLFICKQGQSAACTHKLIP